jgi:hypothetical protein
LGNDRSFGQLAVEKEISDLLKARFLSHFVNVVAAIHQAGIGIDPANFGFAGDHSGEAGAVWRFSFGAHGVWELVGFTLNVERPTGNA